MADKVHPYQGEWCDEAGCPKDECVACQNAKNGIEFELEYAKVWGAAHDKAMEPPQLGFLPD